MRIMDLEKRLSDAANAFSSEVQMCLDNSSCDSATIDALNEIARQAFYALWDYKKAIVEYERSK